MNLDFLSPLFARLRGFLRSIRRETLIFCTGGILYGLIEILWRGYTHPSMLILGGICLMLLDRINRVHREEWLVLRCIRGALIITLAEGIAGIFLNLILHLSVWNYSEMPGNILGQICPFYTICWYFLCYPAFGILKKIG